jgi:predicted transcriptional regulator
MALEMAIFSQIKLTISIISFLKRREKINQINQIYCLTSNGIRYIQDLSLLRKKRLDG